MSEFINPQEKVFNWGDIKRDIKETETPHEDDFDDVYSAAEIAADKARVEDIKKKLRIVEDKFGIPDSRVQEYATEQEIGEMDWFGETAREEELFPEGQGNQVAVFLTSEFDDYISHIDAICLVNNADTDFSPVPFALDMTYNTDNDGLDKKFSWRHPSPQVGLPGFTKAKYVEDTFNTEPLIPKGKIEVMPRFIVGYSPDLANGITELRMSKDAWGSLRRDELSAKAKWCVLTELKTQSVEMLAYLEEHHSESSQLETAYQQVRALDKYFGDAITTATEQDEVHPEWKNYALRDEVCAAITVRKILA